MSRCSTVASVSTRNVTPSSGSKPSICEKRCVRYLQDRRRHRPRDDRRTKGWLSGDISRKRGATGSDSRRSGTSLLPGRIVALTRERPRHRPHSTLRAARHRSLAWKVRPPRGACLHRARGSGARMCFARRQDWRHAPGSTRRAAVRPDTTRCGVLRHHSPDHGSAQGAGDRGGASLVGVRPEERVGTFLGRTPWPRPAEWATLLSICRRPPAFNRTRPALRPGSPWGCSAQVVPTPACVTCGHSWRSSP